jgi:thrombospondin 2/3/4/5
VDSQDNCPEVANDKSGFKDTDGDGIGDECDLTPANALAPDLVPDGGDQADLDGDGILDTEDNCLQIANADQLDTDVDVLETHAIKSKNQRLMS